MAVNFLQHFCKDLMISMILHQTNQMYVITSEYQCVSLYRARNQTRPSPIGVECDTGGKRAA